MALIVPFDVVVVVVDLHARDVADRVEVVPAFADAVTGAAEALDRDGADVEDVLAVDAEVEFEADLAMGIDDDPCGLSERERTDGS